MIDEVNMIDLPLLASIDTKLWKERKTFLKAITIFDRLPLVILIGGFY